MWNIKQLNAVWYKSYLHNVRCKECCHLANIFAYSINDADVNIHKNIQELFDLDKACQW